MIETTATENVNTPEALRRECREALIKGINGYMPSILDEHTETEDLRVLRDILDFADSTNGSILTGIGHALSRERPDTIWVRQEHRPAIEQFAAMLEDADEALGNRKRTTIDEPGALQIRQNIIGWLSTWHDIRLTEWWQLGLAVEKHVSSAVTPVEGAIVEMGGSYGMASLGNHECTLDTLQADLDQARELSESLYNEEQSIDAETPEAAKYRDELQEWLETWELCRLRQLRDFGVVIQRAQGCTTPAEEFICGVVREYAHFDRDGEGLSFKSIESALDEAKDDFEDTVATARYINKRYPQALVETEVAAHA